MAKESSSSSCSVGDSLSNGEPNIALTCDLLKNFLRDRGGCLTGKKEELLKR